MAIYNFESNLSDIKATEKLIEFGKIDTDYVSIPKMLLKLTDINLHTFSWAMCNNVCYEIFQSDSAVIQEINGIYTVYYNENKSDTHNRFSIAHEWGHYELGHDFDAGCKNMYLYRMQEIATNRFAAQLLMPMHVIKEFENRGIEITPSFIQRTFYVSEEAAGIRFKNFEKYCPELLSKKEKQLNDILINEIFADFIERVCDEERSNLFAYESGYKSQRLQYKEVIKNER